MSNPYPPQFARNYIRSAQIAARRGVSLIAAICAGTFLVGGYSLLSDIVEEHEKMCRAEAKVIVHDRVLWNEYVKGANKRFLDRKKKFPETEKSILEYVPGFEERYGTALSVGRTSVSGEIVRDDIYILKDEKIAAQFVDFFASYDSLSSPFILNCIGQYTHLYSMKAAYDE